MLSTDFFLQTSHNWVLSCRLQWQIQSEPHAGLISWWVPSYVHHVIYCPEKIIFHFQPVGWTLTTLIQVSSRFWWTIMSADMRSLHRTKLGSYMPFSSRSQHRPHVHTIRREHLHTRILLVAHEQMTTPICCYTMGGHPFLHSAQITLDTPLEGVRSPTIQIYKSKSSENGLSWMKNCILC